ncbi:MAG: hypothetical protein GMKNLPBB_01958 [Myxococcota bacterium]|nr:hypothetical protein [Myxococcota bacterium]
MPEKPAEPPVPETGAPISDVRREFIEIKKEIIESRNMTIKTDNLVKNLAADIKQIQVRQEQYQKRYLYNSAVSYVLFIVIIATGAWYASERRLSEVETKLQEKADELATLVKQTDERKQKESRVTRNEKLAEEAYDQIREGNIDDAMKNWNRVEKEHVSKFIEKVMTASLAEARSGALRKLVEKGEESVKAGRLTEGVKLLDQAMMLQPANDFIERIHFWRGDAYFKLKKFKEAEEELRKMSDLNPKSEFIPDALWYQGQMAEINGDRKTAMAIYDRIVKEFSNSKNAGSARVAFYRILNSFKGASGGGAASPGPGESAPDLPR